ncbi:ISSpo9, transposase [Citreicella sp. SE45]|nr:ISSpo9, transposase [Citreicella sp. SE45]
MRSKVTRGWFDPDMEWLPPPTGRRGRQQSFSDAAIQTCLTIKVLFGMPLRQTTGFVQSLLRLVGLDWNVPDFSTLCRRQRALNVSIPYRGGAGPLNLLICLQASRPKAKASGTPASTWAQSAASGARYTSASTRKRWRFGPSIGRQAICMANLPRGEVTGSNVGDAPVLPDLLDQIPSDEEIGSVTADGAYDTRKCHEAIAAVVPLRSSRPARTPSRGNRRAPEPSPAMRLCALPNIWVAPSGDPSRQHPADAPAGQWMVWLPPPEPGREQDELHQAARPIPHGPRLRPPGRRVVGSYRRAERLHSARHTRHGSCGIGPSGERGTSVFRRFVQQSRWKA